MQRLNIIRRFYLLFSLLLFVSAHLAFAETFSNSAYFDRNVLSQPTKIRINQRGTNRELTYIRDLGMGGFSRTILVEDKQSGERFALAIMRPDRSVHSSYFSSPGLIKELASGDAKHLSPVSVISEGSITVDGIAHPITHAVVSPLNRPKSEWVDYFKQQANPAKETLQRLRFAEKLYEQGVTGLEELANVGYGHGDVKPDNMVIEGTVDDFIRGRGRLLFIDFDLAKPLDAAVDKISGTPVFIAPELYNGLGASADSRLVDLYALGHSIYDTVFGDHLINDLVGSETTKSVPITANYITKEENFVRIHQRVDRNFEKLVETIHRSNLSAADKSSATALVDKLRPTIKSLLSFNPIDRIEGVRSLSPRYAARLEVSPKPWAKAAPSSCPVAEFAASTMIYEGS